MSIYYDPMICKLVTHAPTRDQALDVMSWSLDNYVIKGVTTNVNLLRDLCEHPAFRAGDVTTKFLPEHYPDGYHGHLLTDIERQQLFGVGAVLQFRDEWRQSTVGDEEPTPPSGSKL